MLGIRIFLKHQNIVSFTYLLIPVIRYSFQKNLMNRFRENFQNLDFWPKKVPFLPCISEITIFPRKGLPHFFVFIVSESHVKKIRGITLSWENGIIGQWMDGWKMDGRTNWPTDKDEFIGPSRRARGHKTRTAMNCSKLSSINTCLSLLRTNCNSLPNF